MIRPVYCTLRLLRVRAHASRIEALEGTMQAMGIVPLDYKSSPGFLQVALDDDDFADLLPFIDSAEFELEDIWEDGSTVA